MTEAALTKRLFTSYVDGEITRKGPVGDQGDGAYSAGVRCYIFPLLLTVHFFQYPQFMTIFIFFCQSHISQTPCESVPDH